MLNKKNQFTILTLLGICILFFVVFKTRSLYFSNQSTSTLNGTDAKTNDQNEASGLKTLSVPKLTIFANSQISNTKIIQNTAEESEDKTPSQTLTSKYLNQVLTQQQIYFTRCYENHLRENSEKLNTGQMIIEFMVLPHGEIRDPVVKESSFQNKTFENCIRTVFARTQIKKFNGDKFLVLYPLEFE